MYFYQSGRINFIMDRTNFSGFSTGAMNKTPIDYPDYEIDYGQFFEDIDQFWAQQRAANDPSRIAITVFLVIFFILGTLSNPLAAVVFLKRMPGTTTNYFVSALAIIDFIVCLLGIPGVLMNEIWYYGLKQDFLCKLWELLKSSVIVTSTFILVAIAFDRFFLICLAPKNILSKRLAVIIIVASVIAGLGTATVPMLSTTVYTEDRRYNWAVCVISYATVSQETLLRYRDTLTLLYALMIIPIITLYGLIFAKVHKQTHKWWKKYQSPVTPMDPRGRSQKRGGLQENRLDTSSDSRTEQVAVDMETSTVQYITNPVNVPTACSKPPVTYTESDSECYKISPLDVPSLSVTSGTSAASSSRVELSVTGTNNSTHSLHSGEASSPNLTPLQTDSAALCPATPSPQLSSRGLQINSTFKKIMQKSPFHRPLSRNSEQRRMFSKPEVRTAQIMAIVTIVYIVSYLPVFLYSYGVISQENGVQKFFTYMYFFNNVANTFIYAGLNKKFRAELVKMLKCRSNRNQW
ncbi:muscarinic acetylcholine receptor M2 [Lingula anatina]|uniref:Muscarinic acetylcholine receptor M2 n=1 Tax=Lingula anatina TaxID=7574 RepID=A0A1S3IFW2_LINAN|nr:muscarinic acetylcholine receptor M2 [Lingula anatina]|eukprot:XP_013397145.1 muscarinic acetylcholine receptor M2 [Lingula anatina]